MATDPRVLQILLGRLQGPQSVPRGGGNFFGDIASALINAPRIVQQERLAQDELARSRRYEDEKRQMERADFEQGQLLGDQRLAAGRQALAAGRREAADASRADFERERDAGIQGAVDAARPGVLGTLRAGAAGQIQNQGLLDLANKTADRFPQLRQEFQTEQETQSQINRNNRPPGQGSTPAFKSIGVDERGRVVILDPSGNAVLAGSGESVRGPIYRSDVTKNDRGQLNTLEQVSAGLNTIDRRFDESQSYDFLDFIRKGDSLLRLQAAVRAIATPLGRAMGEGRITDQDRDVYAALIGGGTTRQVLVSLGLPVESVRESVRKLRQTVQDIRDAIIQTNYDMSGARLDLPASQLNDPNAPGLESEDDLVQKAIRDYNESRGGGRR